MLSEIRLPAFQTIDQHLEEIRKLGNDEPLLEISRERFQREINHHLASLKPQIPTDSKKSTLFSPQMASTYEDLGYQYAMTKLVIDLAHQPLTKSGVLLVAKLLIGSADFRETERSLTQASGDRISSCSPDKLPDRLKSVLQAFNQHSRKANIHPLVNCAQLHHQLTILHPFPRWNGRTARIILNIALMNQGYLPVLVQKKDRQSYYEALEKADKGDLKPLIEWITELEQNSLESFLSGPEFQSIQDKYELEQRFNSIQGHEKCLVLTEDSSSNSLLACILQSSGFVMNEILMVSYEGCSKIAAAHLFSLYAQKRMPSTHILVHRDRDYLTDSEINEIRKSFNRIGVHFFCTTGTDIESHFINSNHLCHCYPKLSEDEAKEIIQSVIDEVLPKSIDYLFKKEFGNRPESATHLYPALVRLVSRDKFRFTHGKTAFRILGHKLHDRLGKKPKLERSSPALKNPSLAALSKKIWKD